MGGIREYLIGVVAAALLCAVVITLINTKTASGMSIKLIAGLVVAFAVIRPWIGLSVDDIFGALETIGADGSDHIYWGEKSAADAYRASIKQQLEAYILDEAKALECNISVEVMLSDEKLPIPKSVKLSGNISPYARQIMTTFITERLGIKQEDQIWT